MLSKILPFNKTLLKKDWRIHQWIIYGFTLILLISGPYLVWTKISTFYQNLEMSRGLDNFYIGNSYGFFSLNNELIYFLMFIIPIIVSTLMMGEEKQKKTIELTIGAPYSRYQIFFNKMVMGVIAIVVPLVITGLIFLVMIAGSTRIASFLSAELVGMWIYKNAVIGVSIFAFATFIGTLCSSFFGQIFLTGIFLFLPVGITGLIRENLRIFMGGLEFWDPIVQFTEKITPALYFGRLMTMDSLPAILYGLLMLCISILVVVVSGILFDIYRVERGPEALTFANTELFFRVGIVICSVLLGGVMVNSMTNGDTFTGPLLGWIIGGIVGYFVPNYLISKNRVA